MTRRSLLPLLACLTFLPGQPARIHSAPAQDKVRPKPRTDRHGDPLPPGAVARLGTVRLQHGEETGPLAFSPDGKTLASGGGDGSVRLWDTATLREVRRFTGHKGFVRWVAFAPDGKSLASTDDSRHRLWDVGTGKLRFEWSAGKADSAGESFPTGLAFAPRGNALAAGSSNGSITLYNAATGKKVRQVIGAEDGFSNLAFSPDGSFLAAYAYSRTMMVNVWDLRTGKKVHAYPAGPREVSALTFSSDGKQLAAAGEGTIRVWAVASRKEKAVESRVPSSRIWSLRFSPDGKTVTAMAENGTRIDWDTRTVVPTPPFGKAQEDFALKALAPGGKMAAATGGIGDIRLVDMATGRERRVAGACPWPVLAVGFARQGRDVLTACSDATTIVWEPTGGRELRRFGPREESTEMVAFSPGGKALAFGDREGMIHLWDVGGGGGLRSWNGYELRTGRFVFSPDGRTLLSTGVYSAARLWAVESGKELYPFRTDAGTFGPVAFAPDGRTFATAEERGEPAQVWDVATGKRRLRFRLQIPANCLAFSPDSTLLAVGEYRRGVTLYRAATGQPVCHLVGSDAKPNVQYTGLRSSKRLPEARSRGNLDVLALAFSPDGKYLASGGEDHAVYLHDVAMAKMLARLPGHLSAVMALAFSPDGKRLVSGSDDRTALVWDVGPLLSAVEKFGPARLDKLWAALGGDAERAGAALNELVAHPRRAVPFLADRLRPAPPAEMQRLVHLVDDLDSDQFSVRQKANKELEAAADRAEPLLRKVLEGKPSLEMRRRVQRLLKKLDRPITSPELLRRLYAIEALERIGTPEAEELLRKLAWGTPETRLTREARAALARPPFRRRN